MPHAKLQFRCDCPVRISCGSRSIFHKGLFRYRQDASGNWRTKLLNSGFRVACLIRSNDSVAVSNQNSSRAGVGEFCCACRYRTFNSIRRNTFLFGNGMAPRYRVGLNVASGVGYVFQYDSDCYVHDWIGHFVSRKTGLIKGGCHCRLHTFVIDCDNWNLESCDILRNCDSCTSHCNLGARSERICKTTGVRVKSAYSASSDDCNNRS